MVFSGGSMEPPLCTNGSAGYLMQLSVKRRWAMVTAALHFVKVKSTLFKEATREVSVI